MNRKRFPQKVPEPGGQVMPKLVSRRRPFSFYYYRPRIIIIEGKGSATPDYAKIWRGIIFSTITSPKIPFIGWEGSGITAWRLRDNYHHQLCLEVRGKEVNPS